MVSINPYLTFNGNCEEAFNFYRSVFGGKFGYIGKFRDMPPNDEYPLSAEDADKIMHVSLPISDGSVLMGSDTSEAFGHTATPGSNFSISVNGESVDEITRIYHALSEGGKVTMPLNKTFWGAYFGMFTDKYGMHWQVNCELKEHRDFEEEHRQDEEE